MCILFIYNGSGEAESDYSIILASNRDEFYDRAASPMAPWHEDCSIIGGRDLQANCDGTWLAWSTKYKKCGILLNLPELVRNNAKSRGKVIKDYMKCDKSTELYISQSKDYFKECNGFIFVTIELGNPNPLLCSYNNCTEQLVMHADTYTGFGNSVPDKPLRKVEVGRIQMEDICTKFNKIGMKDELIHELLGFLRSEERHLPDPQLQLRKPNQYEQLSSIFVSIPEGRYGTRTHTLILVTKTGIVDLIEVTMQPPIDPLNPQWQTTKMQFDMQL